MSTLVVNDLSFELRRSATRRALEITVERGGELVLSAPPGVPDARLRDFVRRKRMWVYKQLARRDAQGRAAPLKAFVEGEGFAYLGRTYRLKLVPESDAAVKLQAGRFVMPKALAANGREHLIRWYVQRAQPWLADKVAEFAARMEVLGACGEPEQGNDQIQRDVGQSIADGPRPRSSLRRRPCTARLRQSVPPRYC